MSPTADPFLASLPDRLAAIEARTRAVVAGLGPDRLAERPPGGGWSVAEVFEHLVLGNQAYVATIAGALERSRGRGGARGYRRSLFGGMLLRAIAETNTVRLPTTPKMRPLKVRDGVVDAFLATIARTAELVRAAEGADLRTRIWSPIAPLPLNLGDAFDVVVTHAERHLGQAERARRAIGA